MEQNEWTEMDGYIVDTLQLGDAHLEAALSACEDEGLPPIEVSHALGKFLSLTARMMGARMVLEVGTLGGFSTIWLARGLAPGGKVISLEADPEHGRVAAANVERAGLADRVDIRVGKALDTLPGIEGEGVAPFDLVFIDADKPNNPAYVDWAVKLSRPGTAIIVDNAVRFGATTGAAGEYAKGPRSNHVIDYVAAQPRLTATAIQTVGAKGWDGFVLAVVE